jgi:histidinol-phosphatase (PHP family)
MQRRPTPRQSGVIVEVSTAGLRKPVGELYPAQAFLEVLCDAGVKATVGSDAHQVSEVGQDIEVAYRALASAGYLRAAFPVGRDEVRYVEL